MKIEKYSREKNPRKDSKMPKSNLFDVLHSVAFSPRESFRFLSPRAFLQRVYQLQ